MTDIGTRLMAHRYLYYVLARPVISDREYDKLEADARAWLPAKHPVHEPGSDLESSYTDDQKEFAHKLLSGESR